MSISAFINPANSDMDGGIVSGGILSPSEIIIVIFALPVIAISLISFFALIRAGSKLFQ